MEKKYYAIKKGKKTGIFTGQWKEIEKKYIKGYSNAQFKGFNDRKEAEEYLNPQKRLKQKTKTKITNLERKKEREIERENLTKAIIYSDDIAEHQNMKTVSIVLTGYQKIKLEDKPGYYQYILIDNSSGRYTKSISDIKENTSPNKAIIMGLIDAISKLKYPCHIKVYTKVQLGFKKMIEGKHSPNSDLLNELRELLLAQEHVVEEIFNVEEVEKLFYLYNQK